MVNHTIRLCKLLASISRRSLILSSSLDFNSGHLLNFVKSTLRRVTAQEEILGHSPLWSWRAPWVSLRIPLNRIVKWLINVFFHSGHNMC